jgi:hypothetical protein
MVERGMATTRESASPASLSIQVIATTVEGTRAALLTAKRLTGGLDARIGLIIPMLTSFFARIDPDYNGSAVIEQYEALAISVGVHVSVLFFVCARYDDIAGSLLSPSSLIIVGGWERPWWATREQRLVSRLTAKGFPVVFAPVGAGDPPLHLSAPAV